RYLHKTRREMPGMYARNPSIILQNMNFSRYYRYRAQLIYSFDLNIIKLDEIQANLMFERVPPSRDALEKLHPENQKVYV
ncbi:hypothetical protein, partial [Hungatella effluvii]|uniref:hypothetical protein n=1 Tax=Hungatella effluvii TaxID=1096246 RepID=UPI003A93FC1F